MVLPNFDVVSGGIRYDMSHHCCNVNAFGCVFHNSLIFKLNLLRYKVLYGNIYFTRGVPAGLFPPVPVFIVHKYRLVFFR